MNRHTRLMATLRGEPVDRPAVCFYELNGLDEHPEDDDPFNIYSHPSWAPLIELTRERTDRIVMRAVPFRGAVDPVDELTQTATWVENGSRYERRVVRCGGRRLTATTRRDPDVNTIWQIEHLLKDVDDLQAYLELPPAEQHGEPDCTGVLEAERMLGDTGIVMIDTADPLCLAAGLFDMATYTVIASTEPRLFHRLLERFASALQPKTEAIAWRCRVVCGGSTAPSTRRRLTCAPSCSGSTWFATTHRWCRPFSVTADLRASTRTAGSG